MTKAAKCDRCGKYYDVDRATNEKVVSTDGCQVFQEVVLSYRDDGNILHAAIRYELCPECRRSIKTWLLKPQAESASDWIEC